MWAADVTRIQNSTPSPGNFHMLQVQLWKEKKKKKKKKLKLLLNPKVIKDDVFSFYFF